MTVRKQQHPPAPSCDVLVVGAGHAGCEAAWAAANAGARVALVTLRADTMGVMSCNPAIGGLAKGQIVREIDALGGLMPLAADAAGLQFKVLNQSRGPAVRGPRAQCDRHAYAEAVQRLIASRPQISVVEAAVEDLLVERGAVAGALLATRSGDRCPLRAAAVVLTTGTFMRGLMHTGPRRTPGGRFGEAPATAISAALERLGLTLGRLKTGTPPRLRRSSVDWESLEEQRGDDPPTPFSELSPRGLNPLTDAFPALEQIDCRITHTTERAHELIRANLDRSPVFNGAIASPGPRYCPSIEDKVVRFADRPSHHVFLEPESLRDETIYCNGISTSLPEDVQRELVRMLPGCAQAEILRYGYAVEYDFVLPQHIEATCMVRTVEGLFLAGQINGTTGYEEAAGQGVVAGLNAARFAQGLEPVTLRRDQAYIGVLLDDLATKNPVEPYRMFTSRAEHRLLLRADNAWDRLAPLGREWGLVDETRWALFQERRRALACLSRWIDQAKVEGEPLARRMRRPAFTVGDLLEALPQARSLPAGVVETIFAERRYAGYIDRQRAQIRRLASMERRPIPAELDIAATAGLRPEAREALLLRRPATFGQALRIAGVNPADVALLLVAAERLETAPRRR